MRRVGRTARHFKAVAHATGVWTQTHQLRRPFQKKMFLDRLEPRLLMTDVSGHLTTNTTWSNPADLMRLVGDLYVDAGVTLTVGPGVQIIGSSASADLLVNGTLSANGIMAGANAFITANSGGRIELSNATFTGGGLTYNAGSTGNLTNTQFGSTPVLALFSPVVSVSGCTFAGTVPVQTRADLVSEFPDNTFTGASAVVTVAGTTTKSGAWGIMGTVSRYLLQGDSTIAAGNTLTISAGVQITGENVSADLFVKGTLVAEGVQLGTNGYVEAQSGGVMTITNSTVTGPLMSYAAGSRGALTNNQLGATTSLDLFSETVSIAACTITSTLPARTRADLVSELTDNTFSGAGGTIRLTGVTTRSSTLPVIGTISRFELVGDSRVAAGNTLTIGPGVILTGQDTGADLLVYGVVAATSLTAGLNTSVTVYSGGRCDLSAVQFTGTLVDYEAGASGSISGVEFGSGTNFVLRSDKVSIAGSTFTSQIPVRTRADLVSELPDNSFTALGSAIFLTGATTRSGSLPIMGTVRVYILDGDTTVAVGTTLTVNAGVQVIGDNANADLLVQGLLSANGATFGSNALVEVRSGGSANFSACALAGGKLTYRSGSKGWLQFNTIGSPLSIDGNTALTASSNNFGAATVTATGAGTLTIDLRQNYWGTTDAATIESRIVHHADSISLPTVLFSPFLTASPTTPVSPLSFEQVISGRIQAPYREDQWQFSATAGRTVQFDLIASAGPATLFTLTGPGGQVIFNNLAADSAPLALPATGVYTLTAHGDGAGYGGTYAFRMLQGTAILLTPGTYDGTYAGSGQSQVFRLDVASPKDLSILLDSAAGTDLVELYVRYGQAPTPSAYDYRYSKAGPDQKLAVPQAAEGPWYILVYARTVAAGNAFSLVTSLSNVHVISSTPDHSGAGATAMLTIGGSGFDASTQVALVGAVTVGASNVTVVSPTTLIATVPLGAAPIGSYGIRVTKGADSETLSNAFRVEPGVPAGLKTQLIMPSTMGRHQLATITVHYENTGNTAIPAPLLLLRSADPEANEFPIMTLEAWRISKGFWSDRMPEGFASTIQILASGATPGILQAGESVDVPVYWAGALKPWDMNDSQFEMEIRVLTQADGGALDWDSLKASLKPVSYTDEAWTPVFTNLKSQIGGTWGSYVKMLDDNATYLGSIAAGTNDISKIWNFQVNLASGMTVGGSLSTATDAAMPAPGLSLSVDRSFGTMIPGRYLAGPFGLGWATTWSTRLEEDAEGTVRIIGPAGSVRAFRPDLRSGRPYIGAAEDDGALWKNADGSYRIVEINGLATTFGNDKRIASVADANGNRITATYTSGSLTKLTHTNGSFLTFTYKAGTGLISAITDSAGRTTSYVYDTANLHLLQVVAPGNIVTTYTYGSSGGEKNALKTIQTAGGTARTFTYHPDGRLASTYLATGENLVTYAYGPGGRVDIASGGNPPSSVYLCCTGKPRKLVDPDGTTLFLHYDAQGQLSEIVDSLGRAQKLAYDEAGNLKSITDPQGGRTSFAYAGSLGQLSAVTDARGYTTGYAYDLNGNLIKTTYADGTSETWSNLNAAGAPQTYTNARSQPLTLEYWPNGLLKKETFADGRTATFSYTAVGNLQQMGDWTGTTTFDYWPSGLLKQVTYPGSRWLYYEYDPAGRRTLLRQYDGYETRYAYDTAGRLWKLFDGPGYAAGIPLVQYSYYSDGTLKRQDNGNGTWSTFEYFADGQTKKITHFAPGGAVTSFFNYTYDSLGRCDTMTIPEGKWTYGYDAIGQLTRAQFASVNTMAVANQDLQYFYDAVGNRTKTIINGVTTTYTANNVNEYKAIGTDTLTYDKDGNLIGRTGSGAASYTFDQLNELTTITQGGQTWLYAYNALGQRVSMQSGGITTEFLFDPLSPQAPVTFVDNGQITHSLIGRGIAAKHTAAGYQYLHTDAEGSVSVLTSNGGSALNSYAYKPFGESLVTMESEANPYQFLGGWGVLHHQTGLSFSPARVLDTAVGAYLSRDPISDFLSNGRNYAKNSPLVMSDPSGLKPEWCTVAGGVAGLLGGAMGVAGGLAVLTGVVVGSPFIAGASVFLGSIALGFGLADTLSGLMGGSSTPNPFSASGITGLIWGNDPPEGAFYGGLAIDTGISLLTHNGLLMAPFAHISDWRGVLAGNVVGPLAVTLGCRQPSSNPVPANGVPGATGGSSASRPKDPNDKLSAAGVGTQHFVSPNDVLPYTIRFENYGPGSKDQDGNPLNLGAYATAPAQQVDVSDTLPATLDMSTFTLTGFGFGNYQFTVPAGTQHYETTVPITIAGKALLLNFIANLNVATRRFTATFQALDPATLLPPAIEYGFLLPEPVDPVSGEGTGEGKGYLTFSVKPLASLATGTEIRNIAEITFDRYETIATDQVNPLDPSQGRDPARQALNTIDAGAPTSKIVTMPSASASSRFTVSWGGTDNVGGSGVGGYDVYVSDNGGAFTAWQQAIAATSAIFAGQFGHTYRFFSIARDRVGLIEGMKAVAESQVTVLLPSGDVTRDGRVDSFDLNLIASQWQKVTMRGVAVGDVNEDGKVDAFDLNILASHWQAGVLAGDANTDKKVDAFDLNVLAAHWQSTTAWGVAHGDFNGDAKVDAFDLNILAAHWQAGVTTKLGGTEQVFATLWLEALAASSLTALQGSVKTTPKASAIATAHAQNNAEIDGPVIVPAIRGSHVAQPHRLLKVLTPVNPSVAASKLETGFDSLGRGTKLDRHGYVAPHPNVNTPRKTNVLKVSWFRSFVPWKQDKSGGLAHRTTF